MHNDETFESVNSKVKIRFFEQSFTIVEPVITHRTLWLRTPITDEMKKDIGAFMLDVIETSITMGEIRKEDSIKKTLGIR